MLEQVGTLLPSKARYLVVVLLLGASLVTAVVNSVYQARGMERRVEALEATGSLDTQLAKNDVQWIKQALEDNKRAHEQIQEELRLLRRELKEKR